MSSFESRRFSTATENKLNKLKKSTRLFPHKSQWNSVRTWEALRERKPPCHPKPHLRNATSERQQKEGALGIWWTGCFKVLVLYRSNWHGVFVSGTTATRPHASYTKFIMLGRAGTDPGAAVALFGHSKLQSFSSLWNWRETRSTDLVPQQRQNNRVMTLIVCTASPFWLRTRNFGSSWKFSAMRTNWTEGLLNIPCSPRTQRFAFALTKTAHTKKDGEKNK